VRGLCGEAAALSGRKRPSVSRTVGTARGELGRSRMKDKTSSPVRKVVHQSDGKEGFEETTFGAVDSVEVSINAKGLLQVTIKLYREDTASVGAEIFGILKQIEAQAENESIRCAWRE